MSLSDQPLSEQWLKQFNRHDLPTARFFLDSLQLVSHDKFETEIIALLENIAKETHGRIALFPVKRPIPKPKAKSDGERERRRSYSSAERIGQLLKNLERRLPRRFQLAPTIKGMRAEKTKHIVLVDDIIGTGGSIEKYCHESLSPSIKSWLSYKKCSIWIVSYAAYKSSRNKLMESVNYLKKDYFRVYMYLPRRLKIWNFDIEDLCKIYGKFTSKSGSSLGLGGLMTPIVFQHGCPNNSPSILWANGKQWRSLFPNRSIPTALYVCFKDQHKNFKSEALWKVRQYRLALGLLERIEKNDLKQFDINLLTFLGLLLRGIKQNNLSQIMLCCDGEIKKLVSYAKKYALIDKNNLVTGFGRDLVQRYRFRDLKNKSVETVEDAIYYYPKQYRGIQRSSS